MARIGDLTTLRATVVDWLDRPDLASRVPDFVNLAEETLARRLNLAENEVMVRLDLVAGRAPLPDDYAAWRSVTAPQRWELDYLAPNVFLSVYGGAYGLSVTGQGDGFDDVAAGLGPRPGGRPRAFTIIGSVPLDDVDVDVSIWPNGLDNPFILTGPSWGGPITLVYRQGLPPLSNDASTNWLLKKAPDLYLYATLLEFEPFLRNDDRLQMWEAKLAQKINDILTLDRAARWGRAAIKTLEATP